jgi:hypothetical protein
MGVDPQKRVGVSYLRGVALFQLQGYDAARVELNKALRLDPRGIYSTLARRKLELCRPGSIVLTESRGMTNRESDRKNYSADSCE